MASLPCVIRVVETNVLFQYLSYLEIVYLLLLLSVDVVSVSKEWSQLNKHLLSGDTCPTTVCGTDCIVFGEMGICLFVD